MTTQEMTHLIRRAPSTDNRRLIPAETSKNMATHTEQSSGKRGICDWCEAGATHSMGVGARQERACAEHKRNLRVPAGCDGDGYPSWHWHAGDGWVVTCIGIRLCCDSL